MTGRDFLLVAIYDNLDKSEGLEDGNRRRTFATLFLVWVPGRFKSVRTPQHALNILIRAGFGYLGACLDRYNYASAPANSERRLLRSCTWNVSPKTDFAVMI